MSTVFDEVEGRFLRRWCRRGPVRGRARSPRGSERGRAEERSRPGRQACPKGSALTARVVELSPATMDSDRCQAVMSAPVVGHSGPHQCSAELSGASRFGCTDIPSFRVQGGTGLERELTVGPGGAWCVSGHSQVGSNSYLGLARSRSGRLTSFDELAPWLCP